jgi:nucleoside-diphosphate-sugar epimerase
MEQKRALVLGCNGFIGHNLVKRLQYEGYFVVGVDINTVNHAYEESCADKFVLLDLRKQNSWRELYFLSITIKGFDEMYQLAADMGGAGYIFSGEHDFEVMTNSNAINHHCAINADRIASKCFFSSSACVYPMSETTGANEDTRECAAYPANPDSEYGWEKLFAERVYLAANKSLNRPLFRIARFHNIFGPYGTWRGGKEKAPAAMIRKSLETHDYDFMEVWGTGEQTRTFLYIDDCLDAIRLLMDHPTFEGPVNIGSVEEISINNLAQMALDIAEKREVDISNIDGPTGVNARKSNNELIETVLNWKPKYTLREGMEKTFKWIESEMKKNG